jgi:hypothetical protein
VSHKFLIALCACTALIPAVASAKEYIMDNSKMKYPNWFAYQLAYRDYANTHRDKFGPYSEEPYLACYYTERICFDGIAHYEAGSMSFIGLVVDGDDRKTVLAHVDCGNSFQSCENYDTGTVNGETVTMPAMPSWCVDEMRKNGTTCKGYSHSLGNKEQDPE